MIAQTTRHHNGEKYKGVFRMSHIRKSKASRKHVDNLKSKGWIILSKVEAILPNGKAGLEYEAVLPIRLGGKN